MGKPAAKGTAGTAETQGQNELEAQRRYSPAAHSGPNEKEESAVETGKEGKAAKEGKEPRGTQEAAETGDGKGIGKRREIREIKEMKEKVSCAQRLRQALDMRQMKQSELCGLTGIGKSAMSQYLKGTIEPRQDRVELLAEKLHVPEAWLMGYDVPMERPEAFGEGWAGAGYYRQYDVPEGMTRLDDQLIESGKFAPIWTPRGETGKKLALALAELPEEKLGSVLDFVRFVSAQEQKDEG